MNARERIKNVLRLLDEYYPYNAKCYLDYQTPWQLLIATILSAQCTDDRVNMVTPGLFEKYKTVKDFATAEPDMLKEDIRSTGFYNNKATNIILCMRKLLEEYNGEVPAEIEDLLKLNGVGRKTANVIRGNIFNIPSIVVDTHVKRVSYRLGFTDLKNPDKIEFDLMKKLPKKSWIRYNSQIIAHGRKICTARNAKCMECFLYADCGRRGQVE